MRIESHNHPSAIEPHQGAATGVGGILRDVFTMGARPLAVHGPPLLRRARPTRASAGSSRASSPASRATATRSACPRSAASSPSTPATRRTRSSTCCAWARCRSSGWCSGVASGSGNLAVLLGSTTGRDGIGGVSVLASAGFGGDGASLDDAKRPSVQVGDPYEEKRLIEACLELLDRGLVVGIQDLGGAGLACATSETAARGGRRHGRRRVGGPAARARHGALRGHDLREPGAHARDRDPARAGRRWPRSARAGRSRATVVGRVVEPSRRRRRRAGRAGCGSATASTAPVLAEVPAASLADEAPLYDRPRARPAGPRRAARRRPDATTSRRLRRDDLLELARSTRPGSTASTTRSSS